MYIGLDLGGTNIKSIIMNKSGDILNFKKIPTGKTASGIENGIAGLVESLASSINISVNKIKAIGIGSAGTIDKKKGMIHTSANIRAFKKYPITEIIEKRTGIRTFLENDATSAIIGEWWKGNGRNYKNWIMLTLGTGIGGGAILDNKLYNGATGCAMEAGHITIQYNGRKCKCGNTGCLELYASATALVRSAKSKLKKYPDSSINQRVKTENLTAKLLYEEAVKEDRLAKKLFHELSVFLGIGVSSLVSIFNPEAVILGGGVSAAHRLIIPVVKEVVQARVQEGIKENVKYLVIKDNEKTPALGAAKVAMDSVNLKK